MSTQFDELVPLGLALADVSTRGFSCGLDKWGHLVNIGLMRKPERIPGTNRLGITSRRIERLAALLLVEEWAEQYGRVTASSHVFWACYNRMEVLRPELLGEALEQHFERIFSEMRREVSRLGPGFDVSKAIDTKTAAQIAGYAAKTWPTPRFIKWIPMLGHQIEEIKLSVIRTILLLMFGPQSTSTIYSSILPAAKALVLDPEGARELAADLAATETAEPWLMDPHLGPNKVLACVRRVSRTNPGCLATAVLRSRRLLDRLGLIVNSKETARYPVATIRPTQEEKFNHLVGDLPAAFAATLLYFEETGNFTEFLSKLDGDEPTRIERGLLGMIEIANAFLDGAMKVDKT